MNYLTDSNSKRKRNTLHNNSKSNNNNTNYTSSTTTSKIKSANSISTNEDDLESDDEVEIEEEEDQEMFNYNNKNAQEDGHYEENDDEDGDDTNCSSSVISDFDSNSTQNNHSSNRSISGSCKTRRKQNKPIRISIQEKELQLQLEKQQLQQQQQQEQLNKKKNQVNNKIKAAAAQTKPNKEQFVGVEIADEEDDYNDFNESQNDQNELSSSNNLSQNSNALSCGLCLDKPNASFPTLNDLKNHLYKDHIEQILNILVTQPTPAQQAQALNQKSSKSMESFCNICKKEVCNKYFLKSHLLNKHGVQLEDYLAGQTSNGGASTGSSNQTSSHAALVAAAVANELIENHAQNLNIQSLNQVVASKYLQNGSGSFNMDYLFKTKQSGKSSITNGTNSSSLNTQSNISALMTNEDDMSDSFGDHQSPNKDQFNGEDGELNDQSNLNSNQAVLFNHYLNLALQQQQQQNQTNSSNNLDMFVDQFKLNQTQPTNQQTTTASGDFCDICQKQFCNKYYLKKHKLDVHGIMENNTNNSSSNSTTATINSSNLSSNNQNTTNLINTTTKTTNTSIKKLINDSNNNTSQPNQQQSSSSSTNLNSKSASQPDPAAALSAANLTSTLSMLMNPFLMQLTNTKQTVSSKSISSSTSSPSSSSSSSSSLASSSVSNIKNEEEPLIAITQNTNDEKEQLTLKKLPINETNENLKLIEELNEKTKGKISILQNKIPSSEVKCDQCTKVFYNKEFLALHKLNKHEQPLGASNSNKQSSLTLPVQLVQLNKEPQLKSHQQQQQQQQQQKTESPNILYNESFCEYCNKSFCNKYFLRTHMSKAHGKTLIIENNTNNTMINSLINNGGVGNENGETDPDEDTQLNNLNLNETYFASKIVDRVQCDICNKQVCNKYFLRTHKQKVHGIYDTIGTGPGNNSKGLRNDNSDEEYPDESGNMNMCDTYDEGEIYNPDHNLDEDKELGELINGELATINPNVSQSKQMKKRRGSSSSINSSTNISLLSSTSSGIKKENGNANLVPNNVVSAACSSVLASSSSITSHPVSTLSSPTSPNNNNQSSIKSTNFLSQLDIQNSYCSQCKRKFYSYNFLRNHMNKIHSIKLPKRSINGSLEQDNNCEDKNDIEAKANILGAENQEIYDEDMDNEDDEIEMEEMDMKKEDPTYKPEKNKTKLNRLPLGKFKNKLKHKRLANMNLLNGLNALNLLASPNSLSSFSSLLSLINNCKIECRICLKEFTTKPLLKQHVLNSHKIKFSDYLNKYASPNHNPSSNQSLARSILLNNSYNVFGSKKLKKNKLKYFNKFGSNKKREMIESSSEPDELKNDNDQTLIVNIQNDQNAHHRKRKNSGNSSCQSIETASSKKSRTSSTCSDYNQNNHHHHHHQNESSNGGSGEITQLMKNCKSFYLNNQQTTDESSSVSSETDSESNLQAFMLEKDDDSEAENLLNNCFTPCLIYLPVKSKINDPISVKIKLKPVQTNKQIITDNNNKSTQQIAKLKQVMSEIKKENIDHNNDNTENIKGNLSVNNRNKPNGALLNLHLHLQEKLKN